MSEVDAGTPRRSQERSLAPKGRCAAESPRWVADFPACLRYGDRRDRGRKPWVYTAWAIASHQASATKSESSVSLLSKLQAT